MQARRRRDADRYAAWRQAIERLRDDWVRSAKMPLDQLERYLASVPVDQQVEAILDLVGEHLRLSWCAGSGRLLEDYLAVLRQAGVMAASVAALPIDVIEDEFLARHTVPHGDMPDMDHYARRFPARGDIQQMLRRREVGSARFLKLSLLGQGASAEVWKAFDRAQQTLVALKLPRADTADRDEWIDRLFREVQLTSALDHPGIVNLRAAKPGQAEAVFMMTLANGNSLSEEIRRYHQPPASRTALDQQSLLERLLHCLASVCDALDHAHAHGIVHGDIKPDNIVIDASGRGMVLDWGLARRLEPSQTAGPRERDATRGRFGSSTDVAEVARLRSVPLRKTRTLASSATGICALRQVAGTLDYMAPEQLLGECDVRTEVFGLGATLYQILSGRAPYSWNDRPRPDDWMRRIGDARFARPRRWNPSAPRTLEAICLKALARDPLRRQPSAAALAADIRHCLSCRLMAESTSLSRRARQYLRWFANTG
jgi:serine/threonine protein kinase